MLVAVGVVVAVLAMLVFLETCFVRVHFVACGGSRCWCRRRFGRLQLVVFGR